MLHAADLKPPATRNIPDAPHMLVIPLMAPLKAGATDFADIRGHESAKRVLTIALAGGHSAVLYGPAGCGKSMLTYAAGEVFEKLLPSGGNNAGTNKPTFAEYTTPPMVQLADYANFRTAMEANLAKSVTKFDLHCEAPAVTSKELLGRTRGTDSKLIAETVVRAREFAAKCRPLSMYDSTINLLRQAMDELRLTPASIKAAIRVARTIANMAGSNDITEEHIAEAVQYRVLDRQR